MAQDAEFLPCGDTGLAVQLGDRIDRNLSLQVVRLRNLVDSAGLPGVVETVPTFRSLLIHYDPLKTAQAELVGAVRPILASLDVEVPTAGRHWRIPVCFQGEEFAPDLAHVADWAGMPAGGLVEAITARPLHVYMLGFAPGQPYMGDLPERLAIPRREIPVPRAPAGSVLIATGMAAVYPIANPTGWHVVGRTPARIFEPTASPPALFAAGDSVSLEAVGASEYDDIDARIAECGRDILRAAP